MELKIAILLPLVASLSACATLDKSSECERAREQYSHYGLNVDDFRVPEKTSNEFISKLGNSGGYQFVDVEWSQFYRNFQFLRDHAVRSCGTADGSPQTATYPESHSDFSNILSSFAEQNRKIKDADDFVKKLTALDMGSSPSLAASLVGLVKYDRLDITNERETDKVLKIANQASSIDFSKPWSNEISLTYPPLKGAMKEDAKEARKTYTQNVVLRAYNDLEYVVYLNPQIQKFLESKIPVRQSPQITEKACSRLHTELRKADLDGLKDKHASGYWRVHLSSGGTDDYSSCQRAIGLDDEFNATDSTREVLNNPNKKMKLMQFLMATAATLELNRVSPSQVNIKMTIDWPKFFKEFQFKNVSDLIEK